MGATPANQPDEPINRTAAVSRLIADLGASA